MRIFTAVLTACLCVPAAQAQDISVKGKVTDSGNAPLVGVGVFIEGTATGTVTDAEHGRSRTFLRTPPSHSQASAM